MSKVNRYRKILVAVDGSDSSKNAFRQACSLSHESKGWITAVTVMPLYQDQFQTLRTKEKVAMALKKEAEKILSEIKEIAEKEDIYIKTLLEEGYPAEGILDTADDGNFDLIVMGRHGKSRLERALMGSVTARVIGGSKKDVLVVPAGTHMGFKTILLATDGSRYSKKAGERAMDLAEGYGGSLIAVSVVDVTDEFFTEAPEIVDDLIKRAREVLKDVEGSAASAGLDVETFAMEGETHSKILELAMRKNIDMICMGCHGRAGIKKLLMGSVTEKVIGYSSCPVLVVRG